MMSTAPTKPSSSHTTLKMKSLVLSGSQSCFSTLLPSPRPVSPPEPMAYRLCTVWSVILLRSWVQPSRRSCRYGMESTWDSSVSSMRPAVPAPTQVRMPPLPDSSRMVPTTATVSTMPDMCGSSASSAITGISGSTGITSCFHTRTCSHSRKFMITILPGLSFSTCGALAARLEHSRIISNFATSEDCSVNPPKRIQRRHPFSGAMVRVTASMASTMRYPGTTILRRKR